MKTLITKLKLALFLRIGESLGFDEIEIDHADGAVTSVTFTKTDDTRRH